MKSKNELYMLGVPDLIGILVALFLTTILVSSCSTRKTWMEYKYEGTKDNKYIPIGTSKNTIYIGYDKIH